MTQPNLAASMSDHAAALAAARKMGKAADAELTKLREQVEHHKQKSSAFAASLLEQGQLVSRLQEQVARYAKQLEQSVGLLRRWVRRHTEDYWIEDDTRQWLTTYDAEAKQKEGEGR